MASSPVPVHSIDDGYSRPQSDISSNEKYEPEKAEYTSTSILATKDWTDAEEKRVVLKLDLTVMALLVFGFFCFQLERGNVANAVSSTLFKDVGITQNQYNTGQGLLYLGIVLLEVPSQMVVQRIGPQKWLTFQVLAFGLVATFQMFMNSYGSFLATRILLGICECGYIPGALYTISTFYKRSELGGRNAVLFIGNVLVSGVGGLMASGILRLHGALKPWQYLFLIEGSLSIFCFFVFLTFLPNSPQNPFPLLFKRFTLFTPREREIILARVIIDDEHKFDSHRPLTRQEIFGTLGNWRNYPHVLAAISLISTTAAMGQYLPTLIKGFGFDTIKANALSSVGGWISLVLMITYGFASDRFKNKGPIVILACFPYLILWIAFQSESSTSNRWAKYVTLTLTSGYSVCWHPLNATWLSLNQKTPQQRAIAMAMFIMAANLGGLVGSQLLRANDAPTYPIGFRVTVCLAAFGNACVIFQHFQYRWSNKRNEQKIARSEKLREDRVATYIY
ncbi:hypothetical protein D1P53_002835 [Cryptococcus gattii VGV]|nr:hypothetical protein D1P53_002835 [Cryptococcus gattii VGV]